LALIGEDLIEIEKEKRKVDPQKFMDYVKERITDDNDYYLLLDEVQNLGSFESVLNGYLRKKNLDNALGTYVRDLKSGEMERISFRPLT
jgi:predicted AAA+ superfamily ATPase